MSLFSCRRWLCLLSALVIFGLCHSFPQAHQNSIGYWMVQVQEGQVHSQVLVSVLDLYRIESLDTDGNGLLDAEEVVQGQSRIEEQLLSHFRILVDGEEAEASVIGFDILPGGFLEISRVHTLKEDSDELRLNSTFHIFTNELHSVVGNLTIHEDPTPFLLNFRNPVHTVSLSSNSNSAGAVFLSFLTLGIEHIFTGYDHIAFLLGLIVLGGSLVPLIGIVSAFTIAHSITLVLATLDVVTLPPRFIEAAIALSICYVAAENLFVKEVRFRWIVSFLFGLVHGFGFSSILRELSLPPGQVVTSLLSFNLGVEVGQVIIVAVALPVILFLMRQRWHKTAVIVTSTLIFGFGAVWFVQRITL